MENRPRILICDDDPLITQSVEAVLKPQNYLIQTTTDPNQALARIHRDSPDLVILDVMMPGMTGFEIVDAVDRQRSDPAFIFITGETSIETAIQAIRKGASDYLRKPFDPEELIVRVEKVLQHRQIARENEINEAEKVQLQGQLRQSQKMEAIGTLAGGIAHDFNNVLSIILGNTELALAENEIKQTIRQNLKQILTASLRAREMIQQLLSFSRNEESYCKPLNLNRILEESLKLMRSSIPTNIEIESDLCDAGCTVVSDATQIHQIMLNLCTNAAHAMNRNGGVLTVRLEQVTLENGLATENGSLAPGNYARLMVADTGKGIEKHIIQRIFDPYFTTKETGKGTGMGLSVVHGIVQKSGGGIKAFSEPGQFTKFHIYLPLADAEIEPEQTKRSLKKAAGEQKHILLVDDEIMLVDTMSQVLRQLGYTVSSFDDSDNALDAFLKTPDKYDLVFTDMTMPKMTGMRLAEEVRKVRRNLPIVLCTGYSEQICEEALEDIGIDTLIMKPLGMQQLAETIYSTLNPPENQRRLDQRTIAPPGTFVISNAHPDERCRLVDISPSGLAYCHESKNDPVAEDDHISIMTPEGDIFISDIHCQVVSELPAGNDLSLPKPGLARRSARFRRLSLHQKNQISNFIHKYSTEVLN